MDLRTIMNNDGAGASHPPPAQSSQSFDQASNHSDHKQCEWSANSLSYTSGYARSPHRPSSVQALYASPEPTYGSIHSPYQHKSAPSPSSQLQHTQSPQAPIPFAAARDSYSPGGNNTQQQPQPTAALLSPYTPQPVSAGIQQEQQSYFTRPRSQSVQSVMTPHGHSRDSHNSRDSPHSGLSQSAHSYRFSPPAPGSLPGTPVRSPIGHFQQKSQKSPSVRPVPSSQDSQPHPTVAPRVGRNYPLDQSSVIPLDAQRRYPLYETKLADQDASHYPQSPQGTGSDSVSTKAVAAPARRQESARTDRTASPQWSDAEGEKSDKKSSENLPGRMSQVMVSQGAQTPRMSPDALQANNSYRRPLLSDRDATEEKKYSHPSKMDNIPCPQPSSSPRSPLRKKRRYNEPPIYARRSALAKGKGPVITNRQPPIPKHLRDSPQSPWHINKRSSPAIVRQPVPTVAAPKTQTKGGPSRVQQLQKQHGSALGPWEPSITGFIPHEEITKLVCDFLFQHVVMRDDIATATQGSTASGPSAVIEIEGKLGHLIDMERGNRLNLPLLTECVINRDSPRFRTTFESSITQAQHHTMNKFLNEAVKASMPTSKPGRIPLKYAHKKERDTLYEVQPSDLPPIIRQNLHPRHKPKVRVTTDQHTGEVLAKIVKCRVADLDIYSPRTAVDWRISVNLEMNYDGDVHNLPTPDHTRGGVGSDRHKDRMSYHHLAYQIDLTQVAKTESTPQDECDHELEVEVSADEVRRQGHLAMAGDSKNQYEDLIKGFVDNIRILARAVPL